MRELDTPRLSLLRNRILLHLSKDRVVWVAGGPGSGKTYLASLLMRSRGFRRYFVPLIDFDNFPSYVELFERGGWGKRRRYYFIDSYDAIKVGLSTPALVVSRMPPETELDIVVVAVDEGYLERWPQVRHRVKSVIRV